MRSLASESSHIADSVLNLTLNFGERYTPHGYAGEVTAVTTACRNCRDDTQGGEPFRACGRTFAPDPTRTVRTMTPAGNAAWVVLAVSMAGGASNGLPATCTQAVFARKRVAACSMAGPAAD